MIPDFLGLLRAFKRHSIDHVVVGGVAAILEGAPMATFDLGVVVRTGEDNLARLSALLEELDARYRDPAGRRIVPTVDRLRNARVNLLETRLGPLDVMHTVGAGWGYDEVAARSHVHEVEELLVLGLDLAGVIATKEVAGREKDRAVLPLLRRTLELKRGGER
jgi:hypothetical protein